MQSEAVYRKDQKTAQEDWIKNNPDYWKNYRSNHKKYADRNREQQMDFLSDQIMCLNFIIKHPKNNSFSLLAHAFQG